MNAFKNSNKIMFIIAFGHCTKKVALIDVQEKLKLNMPDTTMKMGIKKQFMGEKQDVAMPIHTLNLLLEVEFKLLKISLLNLDYIKVSC